VRYWFGWYLLGIAVIILLTMLPVDRSVAEIVSIADGVLGAWGFGWSRALARRSRKQRLGWEPWGSRPPRYNGSGEPCDTWTGACSCGATHIEGK